MSSLMLDLFVVNESDQKRAFACVSRPHFSLRSEQHDDVETQSELRLPGVVGISGMELTPVIADFGTDQEPILGLVSGAQGHLVIAIAHELARARPICVPEDLRAPDA